VDLKEVISGFLMKYQVAILQLVVRYMTIVMVDLINHANPLVKANVT
jgi:hypothetical protein